MDYSVDSTMPQFGAQTQS